MPRCTCFRVPLAVGLLILLGSALAPNASAHLSIIRQQYESADNVEPGDALGRSLAAGDFNGDGYEDLAMGAPDESEDVLDEALHGSVCINYGTPFGLTHLSPAYLTIGAAIDQVVRYGTSLAVGDFDNDGYDDLAVGAPYLDDDLNDVVDAGAVYIYRGGALGLSVTPEQSLFQTTVMGIESNALFGWSLAAGDFNNDSYDDLAVGAPGIAIGAGKVFAYFFTSNNGIDILFQTALIQSSFGQTNQTGSQFGFAVAAANFDGSAGDDLAIGAPRRTLPDMVKSGRVYAVPGGVAGFTIPLAVYHDRQTLGATHDQDDFFGWSLAAGKFVFVAGVPALAIGEPGAMVSGNDNAGRVSLIQGVFGAAGLSSFNQSTGNTGPTPDDGDEFGRAIAAGDFDADGLDDLAVGSPYDDVFFVDATYTNAGIFQIFKGGGGFTSGIGALPYTARTINDEITSSATLGMAVAFGKFDDSGRANLAIGEPARAWTDFLLGDDIPQAGQVHILAPHRQIQNRENRASIGVDCAGNIIYSQRMFHPMPIASITKIMTVLLACEAIDNMQFSENTLYTVPDWLATKMPYGSLYGVVTGEKLTLKNMMELTIGISANDCAWGIGDLLTGADNQWDDNEDNDTNWATVLSDFANLMNIRADQIGMTRTTYSQPAGSIPLGSAFSCSHDQYLLAKAAMQNARFRGIAGSLNWQFVRDNPGNANDSVFTFSNGFLPGMKSLYPNADGVKPGSTPDARKTGVATAPIGTFRIYSTVLGVKDQKWGDPATDSFGQTLDELLRLVDTVCDSAAGWPGEPPPSQPAPPLHSHAGIPTHEDSATTVALVELDPSLGDIVVELEPTAGAPCAGVTIKRAGAVAIAPGGTNTYLFEALQSHQGFRITNRDQNRADLTIQLTHPALTLTQILEPDSTLVLPAYLGPPGMGDPTQLVLTITNGSGETPAWLDVEETGYTHQGPIPSGFAKTLNRQLGNVTVTVVGCDTSPGGSLLLVIRDADHPVIGVPIPTGSPTVALTHYVAPNPFAGTTEIHFASAERGPIDVRILDITGRLVRKLEVSDGTVAGAHHVRWDAKNHAGLSVQPGIYLYRVRVGTQTGSGKVTVLE